MRPLPDGVPARRFPVVNVLLIVANLALFILYELPHLNTAASPRILLPVQHGRRLPRTGAVGYQLDHCHVPAAEAAVADLVGIRNVRNDIEISYVIDPACQPSHQWYRVGAGMPVMV